MATYLELSQLSGNADFLARIAYAALKYAAYIQNEAANATDHAKRKNWQIKVQANPLSIAQGLVSAICLDTNVIAGLGAVTDANLQTATETAANTIITAAISYLELISLSTDLTFLKRAQKAVSQFAMYILNEDPATANHAARYSWARQAIMNTAGVAASLTPALVNDTAIAANLLGTTDAQLQSAVEVGALKLML